jgi:UDP-N-acetylglucosamine 2-epimerase (non-hydrolysing)
MKRGEQSMKFLVVFGTRPEAVKLAPIIKTLKSESGVQTQVCVTGQHRDLLDPILDFFAITPDYDLDLMEPEQALNPLTARLIDRLDAVLGAAAPDRVIVQGDTTSAFAAALAAFHRSIPVAHVEAGLRTHRAFEPFPEEMNRRAIGLIADLHFAPTRTARDNVVAEGLQGDVFVTGNTGVDALDIVLEALESDAALWWRVDSGLPVKAEDRKLVAVTAHRRESFGAPFAAICDALARLAARPDVDILFPLHPNPELGRVALAALGDVPNVYLLPPLDLPSFVALMQRADLILTDSGGVQEEAVTLGRPLLVLREATERPEGVEAGAAMRVGTDPERILHAAETLLAGPAAGRRSQLYGDGRASERILDALLGRPVDEFARDWPRIEGLRRIG